MGIAQISLATITDATATTVDIVFDMDEDEDFFSIECTHEADSSSPEWTPVNKIPANEISVEDDDAVYHIGAGPGESWRAPDLRTAVSS